MTEGWSVDSGQGLDHRLASLSPRPVTIVSGHSQSLIVQESPAHSAGRTDDQAQVVRFEIEV